MDSRKKQTDDRRVNVGISILSSELDVMREAARVDANGPAVLAMARLGIECLLEARQRSRKQKRRIT